MIDVVTDLLLLIMVTSIAWGRHWSRPGSRTRSLWLGMLVLAFVMIVASAIWGSRPLIPGGKPLELLLLAAILLLLGIEVWRHIRADAAALRARRAGP